jgi:hypothetical protein
MDKTQMLIPQIQPDNSDIQLPQNLIDSFITNLHPPQAEKDTRSPIEKGIQGLLDTFNSESGQKIMAGLQGNPYKAEAYLGNADTMSKRTMMAGQIAREQQGKRMSSIEDLMKEKAKLASDEKLREATLNNTASYQGLMAHIAQQNADREAMAEKYRQGYQGQESEQKKKEFETNKAIEKEKLELDKQKAADDEYQRKQQARGAIKKVLGIDAKRDIPVSANFTSEADIPKDLPKGTVVTINGRKAVIE